MADERFPFTSIGRTRIDSLKKLLTRALVLLLPLAGCFEQSPARVKREQGQAPVPPGWTRLFDGVSLNNWVETDFGGQGRIEVRNGALTLGLGSTLTGVTWAGEDFPKTNYEVWVQAMRIDGHDFFCGMTFPVKDSFCSLIVGGWAGSTVGLSSIDDLDASENETTRTIHFEEGRWYTIQLRVTDSAIEAWIDGQPVVSQSVEGRRISIRPEVRLSRPFGIASWQTKAGLRDIRLRKLAGTEPR